VAREGRPHDLCVIAKARNILPAVRLFERRDASPAKVHGHLRAQAVHNALREFSGKQLPQ